MTIIQQRVLPIARLSDDVRMWDGSIVYEVMYLVFEVEAIVVLMIGFLVEVAIFIEVPSKEVQG